MTNNHSDIAFLKTYQEIVEKQLTQTLTSLKKTDTPDALLKAMQYSLLGGGKRIRAILVYLIGELFDTNQKLLNDAAIAIECIHAFSLIHDDLPAIDNATLRRGKPACHIEFGEATAILAADALHTLAFDILSQQDQYQTQRLAMIQVLAKATGSKGMIGGEWLDIDAENKMISLEQLENIHQLKTGKLIEAAILMGAIASNANLKQLQLVSQYAKTIGLIFQIQDDILDVTAEQNTLGKDTGLDEQHNKTTFVSLLGLTAAQEALKTHYHNACDILKTLHIRNDNLARLTDYLSDRQL